MNKHILKIILSFIGTILMSFLATFLKTTDAPTFVAVISTLLTYMCATCFWYCLFRYILTLKDD